MQQPQKSRQPKQFDFDDFYKGREPQRRMRDNMAIESRSDQVYVKPPADFSPQKLQPQESRGQSARDYNFHGGDTSEGRPVYYVVEEPDSLHSDRSPYDFEPADTHTSLSSHVADYTQSGLTQATSGDFVIKEHSYTMCPGCPTFSIPVPIPKAILGLDSKGDKVDYQHARNRTFLEKIGDRIVNGFQKVQTTVMDVIDPIMETGESFLGIEDDQNTLQEKIDGPASGSGAKSYLPMALASMAALAIGGAALFASSSPGTQFITNNGSSQYGCPGNRWRCIICFILTGNSIYYQQWQIFKRTGIPFKPKNSTEIYGKIWRRIKQKTSYFMYKIDFAIAIIECLLYTIFCNYLSRSKTKM